MLRPKSKTINVLLQSGGVGDVIASLTAVNYILKKYPWITPLIWVPDAIKELARNLLPEDSMIWSFSEMKGRYSPERPTKSTLWDGHTSAMKIHPVDYGFLKLCDELPETEDKNYLRLRPDKIEFKDDGPSKYVVVTTGFTADVREFRPDIVIEVVKYIKSTGHEVVFLGDPRAKTGTQHIITAKFDEEALSHGINLVGKTTLVDAAMIINNAAAIVGVDNGLLHVAGITETPIIGGFTTVSPKIRMPYRHNELGWKFSPVTPDESLGCKYCQQKDNFRYGHDYKNCIYKGEIGFSEVVNLCTKQMRPEKFIKQLELVLCPDSQLGS